MTPDQIRQLYAYHFALNRRLWDESIMALSDADFVRTLEYSHGSIRNQAVHLMSTDDGWFAGLRGLGRIPHLDPEDFPNRPAVRGYWDGVESRMRAYLDALSEEQLAGEMQGIPVWLALVHVANHGTDHRAQMLSILASLGAPTFAQDLIHFYLKR